MREDTHMSRRALIAGTVAATAVAGIHPSFAAPADADPVIELRQYKIVHGRRNAFVSLFEREFVDSQEALGMRLVGQFRDLDDPDRYTWIREFPTMAGRGAKLTEFYSGPVWQANRNEANPMLDDNDNVLLLKPATAGSGFGRVERGGRDASAPGLVVATIHYLWKVPSEAFTAFFDAPGRMGLHGAGVELLGTYVADNRPNEFPRLPVRQGEKVFVWFARVDGMPRYERAMAAVRGTAGSRRGGQWLMPDLEERPAQVLRLGSTPRSRI
jgi:hypothetical protein